MAIEIEKKIKLTAERRSRILHTLNEFGADFIGEEFETNYIYGGGILEAEKAALRIRKTDKKSLLTYKRGGITEAGIKRQTEYETEISDAEETARIVESLGFEVGLIYEKRRQTWLLRNIEIVIDELPFGLFMEIEGTPMQIAEAEMILESEDFEVETRTYPEITFYSGKQNGNVIEARFEDCKTD